MRYTIHVNSLKLTILINPQCIFNLAEHDIHMHFMSSISHYINIDVQKLLEENFSNQYISLGNDMFIQCLSVSIWVFSFSTVTSATNKIMNEILLYINVNDFNFLS